jgi:hypothetical protein
MKRAIDIESGWRFNVILTIWAVIALGGFSVSAVYFSQEGDAIFGIAFFLLTFIALVVAIGIYESRHERRARQQRRK